MKILIFGNLLVEKDNLALKLIPKLKKEFQEIEFLEADPIELKNFGREIKIIDTAEGINKIYELTLENLEDFNKLETNKIFSMHDFDLGYNLKLLKKINLIDKVKIICIPIDIPEKEAFNQLQLILRKWVAHDMQGS